jgi:hypothetical protein
MEAYEKVNVQIHIFLTSALAGGEWPASLPDRFTPGTSWIRSWMDPTAGPEDVQRIFVILLGVEF